MTTSSPPYTLFVQFTRYNTMLSSVLLESLFPYCVSANVILGLIAAWFYFVRDDLFSQGASSKDLAKRMNSLPKKAFHNVVAAVLVIAIALLCASIFAHQLKHINKDPVGIVQSRKRLTVRYEGPYQYPVTTTTFDSLTNISYDGSTVAAAAGYFVKLIIIPFLGPWTLGNLLTQQESLLSFSAISNSFYIYFFSVAAGVTSTTWLFLQQLSSLVEYNTPVMSSRDSQAASCLTPNAQYPISALSAQCSPLDGTLGSTQINTSNYTVDTIQTGSNISLFAVKSLIPTFTSTALQVYYLDNQKSIATATLINPFSLTTRNYAILTRAFLKTDDTANMTAITLDPATGALYARFSIVNGKGSLIAGHQWNPLAPLYTENTDFPLTILRNVVFVSSVNKLFVTYVDNADNLLLAVYAPGADKPLFGPILLDTVNPQFYTNDGAGLSNMVLNSQPHTPRLTYLRHKTRQPNENPATNSATGTADLEFATLNFYL